jgi:hypothetical protein
MYELIYQALEYKTSPNLTTQLQRKTFLKSLADFEVSIQYHYPGMQYMGPGTHIINNILNGVLPATYNDMIALIHDINYLQYAGDDVTQSDFDAINSFDAGLSGIAGSIGLYLGHLQPMNFNNALPTLTNTETQFVGKTLKDYVEEDPKFQEQFQNLRLPKQQYDLQKFLPIKTIPELNNLTPTQRNKRDQHVKFIKSLIAKTQISLKPEKGEAIFLQNNNKDDL